MSEIAEMSSVTNSKEATDTGIWDHMSSVVRHVPDRHRMPLVTMSSRWYEKGQVSDVITIFENIDFSK
jgi:hypothetical protein